MHEKKTIPYNIVEQDNGDQSPMIESMPYQIDASVTNKLVIIYKICAVLISDNDTIPFS